MIATLEGHTNNVSFASYHPELPVIISGSEDGTIRLWHANTYRFEQSLNYGLERYGFLGLIFPIPRPCTDIEHTEHGA